MHSNCIFTSQVYHFERLLIVDELLGVPVHPLVTKLH